MALAQEHLQYTGSRDIEVFSAGWGGADEAVQQAEAWLNHKALAWECGSGQSQTLNINRYDIIITGNGAKCHLAGELAYFAQKDCVFVVFGTCHLH